MRAPALILCVFYVGGCGSPPAANAPTNQPAELVLSIVGTNDVHGQLERLPFVAGAVDTLRELRADGSGGVLLVDAGDAFQGTIESNVNEGKAIISAYGVMGYAAMALGNHEFDFGPVGEASTPRAAGDDPQGALKVRIAEAPFPVLAANLVSAQGTPPPWKNLSASTETVVAGVRVGIVGVLTMDAPDVIKSTVFSGLRVAPLVATVTEQARALRAHGAEVVVVVAHAGGACEKTNDPHDLSSCDPDSEIFRFARGMPAGMVDAVVGGHRNGNVAQIVNGIPIVHAASNLLGFSRIDLVLDRRTHRIAETRVFPPRPVCTKPVEGGCAPGDYEGKPVIPDAHVVATIRPAILEAQALRNRPIHVHVTSAFPVEKTHEMALGNLFADLMREAVSASDAAFGNAGSVRDVLPEGDLTFGQLHHVMPFDNQLAKLRLSGKQLRTLVTENLEQSEHGLLSLSGVTVEASCNGVSLDVTLKHPDGAAVRDDEQLTVVTNDFLALGGDGLVPPLNLPDKNVEMVPDGTVLGALIAGLERRGVVSPDDPMLLDAKRPRVKLPGPIPVRCGK